MNRIFLSTALIFALVAPSAHPCSTYLATGRAPVLAKTLDWNMGQGLIFINKRQVKKRGVLVGDQPSVSWVSKYMSLTLSQSAREFPWEGMNEAGLAVVSLQLLRTRVPDSRDPRPAIDSAQWIQYILDTSGSVVEAVKNAERVRVMEGGNIHYFICDASSGCAVLEYVNGYLMVYRDKNLPYAALTNDTYVDGVGYFLRSLRSRSPEQILGGRVMDSLDRFSRAALLSVGEDKPSNPVEAAFLGLNTVAQDNEVWQTHWQLAFDLEKRALFMRTKKAMEIKQISLTDFDGNCSSPVQYLDVNEFVRGNAARNFRDFSSDANLKLIEANPRLLDWVRPILADYSENYTECVK